MTVKRSTRIAERVREELAGLLRGLSDPRLVGALVSRVEVPDDLSSARIYVRRELGAPTPAEQKALLKGLDSAAHRLRRALAASLELRHTPALKFFYDDAPDAIQRVEELLREVKKGQ